MPNLDPVKFDVSEEESPRATVMRFYRDTARSLRGNGYYVRRGVINWNTYFTSQIDPQPGWAIVSDSGSLFGSSNGLGVQENQITFEMFAKVQSEDNNQNMDEALIDIFIEDASFVIRESVKRITSQDSRIAYRVEKSSAIFTERHDLDKGVQGIIVTFNINY